MSTLVPEPKNVKEWLRLALCGTCMGAADIVPGVSGGTIAFILGIYGNLLTSIHHIFKHWRYLLPILVGMAFAILTSAHLIHNLLNSPTYRCYLYAMFFGLIIASVFLCFRRVLRWSSTCYVGLTLGIMSACVLTTSQFTSDHDVAHFSVPLPKNKIENHEQILANYDVMNERLIDISEETLTAMVAKGIISKDTPVYRSPDDAIPANKVVAAPKKAFFIDLWLFLCGTLAISAMLLPGISGSYILVILGVYPIIIGALADIIRFDIEAFTILLSVGLGIICGAMIFARVIGWSLSYYHDVVVAILTGFMIGSLPSMWPFYSYQFIANPLKLSNGPQIIPLSPEFPDVSSSIFWIASLFSIGGFLWVMGIHKIAQLNKTRDVT